VILPLTVPPLGLAGVIIETERMTILAIKAFRIRIRLFLLKFLVQVGGY
jgi:hypothetical protein